MRVLHVIGQLVPGGSEKVTLLVADAFRRRGAEHRIAVLGEIDEEFVVGLGAGGVAIHPLNGRATTSAPRVLWQLRSLARRHRVDVVQGHAWRSSLAAGVASRLCGTASVATLHRVYYPKVEHRLDHHLQRLWDRVAVDSSPVRDLLVSTCGFDLDRIEVVPNFVPTAVLDAGARARPRRGGLPLRVLVAAHFTAVKGHRFLIEAIAQLERAEPGRFEVDLLGEGPLLDEARALTRSTGISGVVRFHGRRSDLLDWLGRADVVALPSLWEGFGMILAEAGAFSLPVVAFGIGGAAEVVVDGATGLLVPPGDVQALAAALDQLQGDEALRLRLGAAGRARVERCYAEQPVIDEWQRAYARAVAA